MRTDTAATTKTRSRTNVRRMAQMGMLAAISVVLMLFEIPLPFAPAFYEIDFSEVPVMVGCFTMGPVAGAGIELLKILLNLAINGTDTAGVGEFANFLIGCALIVPAAVIYKKKRTKAGAITGMIVGTAFMTVVGCFLNAFVLLPAYAKAFGMPMDALIGMGAAVNSHITSLATFAVFAVAPFNLLKGFLVSVIVLLIYKKISPVLKMGIA
ncbi:MAG: ECF transporter S component [Lachnospiraceae bacterium]